VVAISVEDDEGDLGRLAMHQSFQLIGNICNKGKNKTEK
jgi:hypothetical protein